MKCGKLIFLGWLVGVFAVNAGSQNRSSDANLIGVELLGRAGIYSANYERTIAPRVVLGGGIAYWSFDGDNLILAPAYISVTPVGHTHSPYIAAGITVGLSNITIDSGPPALRTARFGTLSFGYQFRSPSGFVVRPMTNFMYGRNTQIWWPGVTIGHSF